MLAGVPVLAANEGGPVETVVEAETGWLRDASKVEDWTQVMERILDGSLNEQSLHNISEKGRQRVTENFSKETMAVRFEEEIGSLSKVQRPPVVDIKFLIVVASIAVLMVAITFTMLLYR